MSLHKYKSYTSAIKAVVSVATLALVATSIFSTNINVNAQLGLEPFGVNKSDPKETGWFKYVVNPGDTIEDFVVISNMGADDASVDLRSNDAVTTQDGAFTIVSNEVENKEVGKWVTLQENIVAVPGLKAVKVPFKITVPSNIKAGEYAGGLSITEIDKSDANAPVAIKTRIGNRIYIIVKGGDLNVSTDVKGLEIVNPKSQNFAEELRKRGYIKTENMVFKMTTENKGNVYAALKGKYKITLPDGKIVEQSFTRVLTPRDGAKDQYIETQIPYQKGKTTLELSYETQPQHNLKDPSSATFKYSNDKGNLTYTMDLSDEDLNSFKTALNTSNQNRATRAPVTGESKPLVTEATPQASAPAQVVTEKEVIKEVPADNSMIMYVGVAVGLLLLILIGLVGYKLYADSKSKSEPKSESKEKSKK